VLKHKGYSRVVDMVAEEEGGRYFEGTGVLVLDRINGVAYVAISERADAQLAEIWAQHMGYRCARGWCILRVTVTRNYSVCTGFRCARAACGPTARSARSSASTNSAEHFDLWFATSCGDATMGGSVTCSEALLMPTTLEDGGDAGAARRPLPLALCMRTADLEAPGYVVP
jgi:N,N dimethylarginine dimethylhydrolase, eukaryotic